MCFCQKSPGVNGLRAAWVNAVITIIITIIIIIIIIIIIAI